MNRVDAKNEIFAATLTGWNLALPPIVGTNHELRYYGVKYQSEVPVTKFWGRISLQTVLEEQTTLRNSDQKRYSSNGILILGLFIPTADAQAATKLDLIAEGVRNIFRVCTPPDNVQFARARINDNIDPEAAWLRANVIAEWQYDQIV